METYTILPKYLSNFLKLERIENDLLKKFFQFLLNIQNR